MTSSSCRPAAARPVASLMSTARRGAGFPPGRGGAATASSRRPPLDAASRFRRPRCRNDRGGDRPGVLAERPGWDQNPGVAQLVDRLRDLTDVAEARLPAAPGGAQIAAVALGRRGPRPVHRRRSSLIGVIVAPARALRRATAPSRPARELRRGVQPAARAAACGRPPNGPAKKGWAASGLVRPRAGNSSSATV